MPMFHYEATDRRGKTVIGSMDAKDEGAVRMRLAQGGYTPTLIETSGRPAKRAAAAPSGGAFGGASGSAYDGMSSGPSAAGSPGPAQDPYRAMGGAAPPSLSGLHVDAGRSYGNPTTGRSRPGVSASSRDLAQFYRQMATAVRSGVPLTQVLPSIKGRVRDRVMRRALEDIEAAVARGRPISEAMALHPRAFSLGHIGLVQAGEGGGFLDKAFDELATQAEADWGVEAATKFNILLFIIKWAGVPFLVAWLVFMVSFMPMIGAGIDVDILTRIAVQAILAGAAAAVFLNVVLPLAWKAARGTRLGDTVNNIQSAIPMLLSLIHI